MYLIMDIYLQSVTLMGRKEKNRYKPLTLLLVIPFKGIQAFIQNL